MRAKRSPEGIRERHSRKCSSLTGGRCNCTPSYEAFVYSQRDGKKLRRTFVSQAEARSWRIDTAKYVKDGALRSPSAMTLREAAQAWLARAEAGEIRNRSGDRYKPSPLRSYETSLRRHVLPTLGAKRLSEITRADLQRVVGQIDASPSTIRNAINPLRAIFRDADLLVTGGVPINPTTGLRLPAVRGRRDRIVSPEQAAQMIAALPERDRALWATAFYAGLRLGELQALRWTEVDFEAGVIRVEHAWDKTERRLIEPKSRAGKRTVPIPEVLRAPLAATSSLPAGVATASAASARSRPRPSTRVPGVRGLIRSRRTRRGTRTRRS